MTDPKDIAAAGYPSPAPSAAPEHSPGSGTPSLGVDQGGPSGLDFAKLERLTAAALRFAALRIASERAAVMGGERIARQGKASCGDVPTRAAVIAAERAFLDEARPWL